MHELDDDQPKFIVIQKDQLSADAYEALLDEFILREGTDYGTTELTMEQKRARASRQLESGHVSIVYSPETENCTIRQTQELDS